MVAAGDADSTLVKNILTRYANFNDDVQERYIRRLPIWNSIKKKYLQKRVMEQAEWKLLPKAVAMICNGEVE